jgi:hypothetical protein
MIREALDAYARGSARTFADRHLTVGASEVGQCARRIFWVKMEDDPTYGVARNPEYVDGWGAARRGATFEDHFWVPAMRRAFGDKLLYAGDQQQTLVSEFLSATPDGLLIELPHDALAALGVPDIGAGDLVVECKTCDPRTRLEQAKPEHVYQAQVQIGLLRELTPHRPNFAVISYTDASFWDACLEFVVAFDPAIYATAKERARNIMLARSATELSPEGWVAGAGECKYCPFTTACGRARKTAAEVDPQFIAEVDDLAHANARGGSTFLSLRRSGSQPAGSKAG